MRSDGPSVSLRPPARHRGLRGFLGVHPALVLLFGVALVLPGPASANWTFSVMAGMVFAISCLGLLVLVGWAREISLAQAGLTGSGLYVSSYAYRDTDPGNWGSLGWPFPVAVAGGIGFVVAVSFVTALVSMRLAGAYVLVMTLSVQFWLENAIFTDSRFNVGFGRTTPRPDFFTIDLQSDGRFYYLVLGCLLVVTVFLHRARHSRFGRSMIMAGADPTAAAVVGVSPWRYRVWAFVIAGAFAGLAGALSAPMYLSAPGSFPYVSFNSLLYLAVPVLAGCDSIVGTVVAAVALTLAPWLLLEWRVNGYLLAGLGMAVGCMLGPRGLAGAVTDRLRGRPSPRARGR